MSYSFAVRVKSKATAKLAVAHELEKVVASQAIHAKDQAQAQAAADSFIDLLREDETKDITVNVSGWVQWDTDESLHAANFSVTASHISKEL